MEKKIKEICVQHTRTNTQLISLTCELQTDDSSFLWQLYKSQQMHRAMEFGWIWFVTERVREKKIGMAHKHLSAHAHTHKHTHSCSFEFPMEFHNWKLSQYWMSWIALITAQKWWCYRSHGISTLFVYWNVESCGLCVKAAHRWRHWNQAFNTLSFKYFRS